MKYPHFVRAAGRALVLCAAFGAGSVFAQPSMTVITDVGPLPAEERESAGAIVLDGNRVQAQRDAGAQRATTQMGAAPMTNRMGAGPASSGMSVERARYEAEQARVRQEEADLKRKGAASALN